MLGYLIATSYAQVYATFANECGDVCCGKEDEGDLVVLDKRNVEAIVAVELDVGATQ